MYDKDFLYKLDRQRTREIYARIIALSWDETPLETIEGKVTGGSINIDGASAVRRSCSLSLVAKDININLFYWGLNSKFQLYIGIKNTVDSKYEDIIWFKQGTYIVTSFNTSQSVNNFTISISGKDKMCLLNGELGGQITASTDFGVLDDYSSGELVQTKVLIKDIIRNLLYTYAKEPYQNIRIFDLDEYGLELLEYKGDNTLYFIKNGNIVQNMTTNGSMYIDTDTLKGHAKEQTKFKYNGIDCKCQAVNQYEAAGYRITDLTYAGDLIANVGENITSILDKIKNMLGEFEYFYDVDGNFIFQRKKIYINIPWNQEAKDTEEQVYIDPTTTRYKYYFEDSILISSFQNTPNLAQIRNDFSIWGTRKTISGSDIPIHLRYAIDKKPIKYKRIWDKDSGFTDGGQTYEASEDMDWRELIYQMALDYFGDDQQGNWTKDEFKSKLMQHNPWCKNGITGYEQYYTDLQGFWRQLYDPNKEDKTIQYNDKNWNVLIDKNPAMLNFWFDFLDADGSALARYSVPAIGQRNKVTNDSQVKAIKYKETPEVIYNIDNNNNNNGMTLININSALLGAFSISAQGKSAMDVLNEQLYQYSCMAESISINSLPVYYLEPNVRIKVLDKNSGIDGEYIVNKITLPLTYNGNMSISATKVVDRII